jgi:hypothetical protein
MARSLSRVEDGQLVFRGRTLFNTPAHYGRRSLPRRERAGAVKLRSRRARNGRSMPDLSAALIEAIV